MKAHLTHESDYEGAAGGKVYGPPVLGSQVEITAKPGVSVAS